VKRGSVVWRRTDLNTEVRYRADVALRDYREKGRNKERGLKIASDHLLEAHIRKKILEDRYSPDAIIGEIKLNGFFLKA
jgi:IS30 family transposase